MRAEASRLLSTSRRRNSAKGGDRQFVHLLVFRRNRSTGDSAVERASVRVYGMLLGGLLAVAGISTSVNSAGADPSAIIKVDIVHSQPIGSYSGRAFRYVEGAIHGEVSSAEPIAGLRALAAGRSTVPYQVNFQIVAPEYAAEAEAIVVEAANRGRSIFPGAISVPVPSADPVFSAIGDGFLLSRGISVAAIQWQTGFAAGVPSIAQGIGQVVVRDFGRWLGGAFRSDASPLPIFHHRVLAGVSQAAWFVNSLIAEGFNVDPDTSRGVYQGAFTRNGNGVVLAINGFAAERGQFPYARADLPPLVPDQLLLRPASDPEVVDVISLNDFYRLRASVSARAPAPPGMHRYATAAPHASGYALPDVVFAKMKCNGGAPIALSKVRDALYLRPLILSLFASISETRAAKRAFPADAPFTLEPAPAELEGVNRLDQTPIWTPKDAPNGMPLGGIPTLEAVLPLGLPRPIALSPVEMGSINDTCGNFSGWEAFSIEELNRRYGGRANYMGLARRKAADLVAAGYLLDDDEAAAVREVELQLPKTYQ
jgi:Alpha/beta hydrolase domain